MWIYWNKYYKDLIVLDNLSKPSAKKNLLFLKKKKILFKKIDIAKSKLEVEKLIRKYKPKAIFHLAGQVAMSSSIHNPINDFHGNVTSTLNILEAIRKFSNRTILIYSSTNKVYGDLENYKYTEKKNKIYFKK